MLKLVKWEIILPIELDFYWTSAGPFCGLSLHCLSPVLMVQTKLLGVMFTFIGDGLININYKSFSFCLLWFSITLNDKMLNDFSQRYTSSTKPWPQWTGHCISLFILEHVVISQWVSLKHRFYCYPFSDVPFFSPFYSSWKTSSWNSCNRWCFFTLASSFYSSHFDLFLGLCVFIEDVRHWTQMSGKYFGEVETAFSLHRADIWWNLNIFD